MLHISVTMKLILKFQLILKVIALHDIFSRIDECRESAKIVKQVLDKMPQGPVHADMPKKVLPQKDEVYTKMEELIHDFMIVNFGINPPVGEIYHAIEGSKGELGFYLVSKGDGHPWKCKIRSPSFNNIQSFTKIGYRSFDLGCCCNHRKH